MNQSFLRDGFLSATSSPQFSRRDFLVRVLQSSAIAAVGLNCGAVHAADLADLPIVVFSKVYQTLKLSYEEAAEVTAEAGLQGVDAAVRAKGEVLPERATQDLPRYAEALRRHNLKMPLMTTDITGVSSPHAESVLRTAKKNGVNFYRLGFINRAEGDASEKQIREVRAELKDVAAMNKEIGLGALLQNHSPSGEHHYLGGDLTELEALVEGFDPAQIGVAFDIGHAVIVHGEKWRPHFEKLKPHLKIAYVKDAKREGRWVPFGEGELASTGYFKVLKQIGYHAPISMHLEYDWAAKGKSKTREALVKAMKESAAVLRGWLSQA